MTIIPITLFTSGVLGLLYMTLTAQVVRQRQKHNVSLGDGGVEAVQIAIRAHGNFAEYTPLALILLGRHRMGRRRALAVRAAGADAARRPLCPPVRPDAAITESAARAGHRPDPRHDRHR